MNFSLTKDQQEYQNGIRAFAKDNFGGSYVDRDKDNFFSREDWEKCAAFGLQGLATPIAYGGSTDDLNILTATIAMEGFGYGCRDNGLPFGLNAQMWTVQYPIFRFGTEYQKKKFLPQLASGKWIGCHALTEPNSGSDVYSMETTAKKVDGGYIIDGTKRYITFAPISDVVLVFVKTDPNLGQWGMSAFLVEKGTKGFTAGPNRPKMGLRTVPFGDLFFEDCFVPDENLLGNVGAGWAICNSSLEHDRCTILAAQLGAMEYQLEESIAFVKERKQFGKPVGQFQSVSNRIADMKLRLETSRLLLYKVAWLNSTGSATMIDSALLKLHMSENFIASSLDSVRNHGGQGYLSENEVERNLRDAVGGVIYAGTSDIQRNIISKLLGL